MGTSIELSVVGSSRAGVWRRHLEAELARTRNLSASPMRADAVVVIIDPSFTAAMHAARNQNGGEACFDAIQGALASGKVVLPVAVDRARIPDTDELPEEIRALGQLQGVALERQPDLPGIAARLVFAARTMLRPTPQKTLDRTVFISYRREDSWYWATLLARALTERLSAAGVFFDIGSITPGRRFDAEIGSRVQGATDVVIVVGAAFLATDPAGKRRLDGPSDFVRREIAAAVAHRKPIHVVLAGSADLPPPAELPADIAPAFEDVLPLHLTDYRDGPGVAAAILGRIPQRGAQDPLRNLQAPSRPHTTLAPGTRGSGFMTAEEKCRHLIMAAVPSLADLGWRPVDLAETAGALLMVRDDSIDYRFAFDFNNFELILLEHARSLHLRGTRRWVKRAIFPLTPDAADVDVLVPPNRQVEAMVNPAAYLDRTGRLDLDDVPRPPMSPADLEHVLRSFVQPGQPALAAHAYESTRIRARGGLRALSCIERVHLRDSVIAFAVAFDAARGSFAAAASDGAYSIDVPSRAVERIFADRCLRLISVSIHGTMAVIDEDQRLTVVDSTGQTIVRRWSPYSAWRRMRSMTSGVDTLSWTADGDRLAIAATHRIWIYDLQRDEFDHVDLPRDGQVIAASARFFPRSDDLVVLHLQKLWTQSSMAGTIHRTLDIASSEFFGGRRSRPLDVRRVFRAERLAVSPDGTRLALGGNDAQLVLFEAATLEPKAMRVWHAPLVRGRSNGAIEQLAFSPDGRRLVSVANDGRLVVGDVDSGDSLADGFLSEETWNEVPIRRDVCWTPDGSRIAAVSGRGAIEIWDADTARTET